MGVEGNHKQTGAAGFDGAASRSLNVQLTFNENNERTIGGVKCVMTEPDIDYYEDLMRTLCWN